MFDKRAMTAATALAGCLAVTAASASATWPTSIVGSWNGYANTSQVVLTVATQQTGGKCPTISGSLKDLGSGRVDNVQGFYCPSGGTLAFMRASAGASIPYQVYTASLSQSPAPSGLGLLMAGSFGEYAQVGKLGLYGFSLSH